MAAKKRKPARKKKTVSKKTKKRSASVRPDFWKAKAAAAAAPRLDPGARLAKISITGQFSLVSALIEGYEIPLADTAANTVGGQRKIQVDQIVTINLRFVSTDATIIKADVSIDGQALEPILIEVPGGDTGYVTFFRSL